MRFPIYTVVVPILAAAAFAQETPPVQPTAQPKQPTESATPKKPASLSKGQSDPTSAQTAGTASSKGSGPASDRLPEMKTATYSGTLMDASCAGSGSAAATPPSSSATAPSSTTSPGKPADPAASSASTASTSSADRSAPSGSSHSCTVSASTTQFALKMKDGNTVRFDEVGNVRMQEAMKTHKKWSDSASASTPIRVKASGVLNGDKLTVLSVN